MEKILFGSSNRGKLEEARKEWGKIICSPSELVERVGSVAPEVIEDGTTYFENARKKVEALFAWSGGMATFSDDTGLEVMALHGAPGLHSARYAGPENDPAKNIAKLLEALRGAEDRRARFVCTLVYKSRDVDCLVAEGELCGRIASEQTGRGGFGYDSVFIVDGFHGKTLAELKQCGDGVVTHRVAALRALKTKLQLPPRLVERN